MTIHPHICHTTSHSLPLSFSLFPLPCLPSHFDVASRSHSSCLHSFAALSGRFSVRQRVPPTTPTLLTHSTPTPQLPIPYAPSNILCFHGNYCLIATTTRTTTTRAATIYIVCLAVWLYMHIYSISGICVHSCRFCND